MCLLPYATRPSGDFPTEDMHRLLTTLEAKAPLNKAQRTLAATVLQENLDEFSARTNPQALQDRKTILTKLQSGVVNSSQQISIVDFAKEMELTRGHISLLMDELDTDDADESFPYQDVLNAMNRCKGRDWGGWHDLFDENAPVVSSTVFHQLDNPLTPSLIEIASAITDNFGSDKGPLYAALLLKCKDKDVATAITTRWLNARSPREFMENEAQNHKLPAGFADVKDLTRYCMKYAPMEAGALSRKR